MRRPQSAALQGKTIVVVEDDPLILQLMNNIVEDLSFTPQPFNRADDALIFILRAHKEIRLLITDFMIIGSMSGGDLAIAVSSRFPEIPVILISALLDADYQPRSEVIIIPKPWSCGQISSLILKMTNKTAN